MRSGYALSAESEKRIVDAATGPVPANPIPAMEDGNDTAKSKSWAHLVAGASGGMVTAVITSPLDVLRTRLQSDFYHRKSAQPFVPPASPSAPTTLRPPQRPAIAGGILRQLHLGETFRILATIRRVEGWRGFFRGLGPSLTGVVPASAVKLYTYGNCKRMAAQATGWGQDSVGVSAAAAMAAGIATGTATNPIWLVKTRLQLDKSSAEKSGATRQYRSSMDCVRKVLRAEGVRGLYSGLTASYLGTIETTVHLVLYEQLKKRLVPRDGQGSGENGWMESVSTSVASGAAKVLAVLATYPHEVVRTRLRQVPEPDGRRKYTGLVQCFVRVWREEGVPGLYGGLAPHLLRSAPSAAILLGVYEFVVRVLEKP